jgi:hypothetical protein
MGENKFTTRYQDNYQSAASAGGENVLTIVGLASDGPIGEIQSFSGMAGVASCEAVFGEGGTLPRAVRRAIEAVTNATEGNPIQVNAMRVGSGYAMASISLLNDSTAEVCMTIAYDYAGIDGNEWQCKVEKDDEAEEYVVTLRRGTDGTAVQFTGSTAGEGATPVEELVEAINAGGLGLTATLVSEDKLLEIDYTSFTGGLDGTLTNAQAILAMQILESKKYMNFYVVGWKGTGDDGAAVRAALNTHCNSQLSERDCERFAFVEAEDFSSVYPFPHPSWYTDMATWASGIATSLTGVDMKNLIMFAGGKTYTDGAGTEYEANVAAEAAALWLALPINRSMINVQVPNTVEDDLAPNIPAAYRAILADARCNYMRFEDENRGVIIANDRTLAATTSDYKYVDILRTQYTCGQEARIAGKPAWGKPDDGKGSGLDTMKDLMESTLDRTRVGKTIVAVKVTPEFVDDDNVEATMAVTHYRTMRSVDHVVHVERS